MKGPLCFNCKDWGHIGAACPKKKVFKFELAAGACDYYVTGTLAGCSSHMKLDSGAQHTIVSRAVFPETLPTGGTIRLKGATGMQVGLPLTEIDFNFDGQVLTKVVAVSDVLEEDPLLGTDLPIFNDLMRKATEERAQALPAVMAVQTRNARQQQEQQQEKEDLATYKSGASIIPCGEIISNDFDMFVSPPRHKQTRREKRLAEREFSRRATQMTGEVAQVDNPTNHTDLQAAQRRDPTLQKLWHLADDPHSAYCIENDLLYHPSTDELNSVYKRSQAIRVAHSIPMAGHLGHRKTKQRLLKCFYWPGLSKEVKDA